MVPELMRAFNLNGSELGNLAAVYFYTYLLMQLPAGLLLDYLNPRRLIALAILLCAGGAIVFAEAPNETVAALSRLIIGIGAAFAAVGPMKLISYWLHPKHFALVAGLMIAFGILGAVGGQAPLSAALARFGWRNTLLTDGIIGLGLAGLFYLTVQNKSLTEPGPRLAFYEGLLAVARQKQSWLISVYSGLVFAPLSAFAGLWGIPYLMQLYQKNRTDIAALMSLVFIGFAIGSPLSGWLSGKIKARKPLLFYAALLPALCLSGIIYLKMSLLLLGVLLGLFGLFTGFFFVSFAAIREINDQRSTATAMGFINTFNALGGALAIPIIGYLLDLGWQGAVSDGVHVFSLLNYHCALLCLPLDLLLAVGLLWFIQETYQ